MLVLPLRSLQTDKPAKRLPVGWGRLLPIFLDRVPSVAQALHITVSVLGDDRRNPFGVGYGQTETGGRAIIEHVGDISLQIQCLHKSVNRHSQIVEGVSVLPLGWHLGKSKTRQIRRDHPER